MTYLYVFTTSTYQGQHQPIKHLCANFKKENLEGIFTSIFQKILRIFFCVCEDETLH